VLVDETIEMAKKAGLADIKIEEKAYNIDVMADCSDPLYREVKQVLPKGKKLSDYIISVNVTALKK
jgi:hypothetical protein